MAARTAAACLWPSIKCSIVWKIPSPGSRSFPPISRMNSARRIANLRGEAEVCLTRDRAPEEYREVIESSLAECERLSGIIDNLLFLARAEAGPGQVERKRFSGRAAVEKILAYYESVAEEHGVTLTVQGDNEISADQLLFDRALSNLIENALRHTAKGGRIEVDLPSPLESSGSG